MPDRTVYPVLRLARRVQDALWGELHGRPSSMGQADLRLCLLQLRARQAMTDS